MRPTYRWTKFTTHALEEATAICLEHGWQVATLADDAPDGAVVAFVSRDGTRRAWIVPRRTGEALELATAVERAPALAVRS